MSEFREEKCSRFCLDFIAQAPTQWHAVWRAGQLLEGAGFTRLREEEPWGHELARQGFCVRDGALFAWRLGERAAADAGMRLFVSHSDSPGFLLKGSQLYRVHGFTQARAEVYGGPLLYTWFDRDLAVAGRAVDRAGREHLVRTEPLAKIPSLAIHLDRDQDRKIDRETHVRAVFDCEPEAFESHLLTGTGLAPKDILASELRLVPVDSPRLLAGSHMLSSPRLDNLSSLCAGLFAFLHTPADPEGIQLYVVFDHEELGSQTRAGAHSTLLNTLLRRFALARGVSEEAAQISFTKSWVLSADAAHAIHPNYPEKHDERFAPIFGHGVAIKQNANARYASDVHGEAYLRKLCDTHEIPLQQFVSSNSVPCGSTVGPYVALGTGMRTIDLGVPILSMHSVSELAHTRDLFDLARIAQAHFS